MTTERSLVLVKPDGFGRGLTGEVLRRIEAKGSALAGLDVLRVEPMVQPPSMLELDNLIVTPHVAASTTEGLRRMAWDSAGNVIDFLAGKVDRDAVVNVEVLSP